MHFFILFPSALVPKVAIVVLAQSKSSGIGQARSPGCLNARVLDNGRHWRVVITVRVKATTMKQRSTSFNCCSGGWSSKMQNRQDETRNRRQMEGES